MPAATLERPWQLMGPDFFQLNGSQYTLEVIYYARVDLSSPISPAINCLKGIFASCLGYSQVNGQHEKMTQTVTHLLKKAKDPYLPLMAYRSTQQVTDLSQTEIRMGHRNSHGTQKNNRHLSSPIIDLCNEIEQPTWARSHSKIHQKLLQGFS